MERSQRGTTTMRLRMWAQKGQSTQCLAFRRGVYALLGCLVLLPVALAWYPAAPAVGSAAPVSQATSSTTLSVVALAGSSSPTFKAKVIGVPSGAGCADGLGDLHHQRA